jgi:signal recognition particle subunit SRP54
MFDSLSDRLQAVFAKLGGKGILTEDDVDTGLKEVRKALLEADVNFKVVKDFVARIREKAVGEEVLKSLSPAQQVIKIVHDELVHLLGDANVPLAEARPGPTVIMLVGLQGAGKTTTIAKLAMWLRKKGKSPLLVAADVYRPAAITQLQSLGKQINIPVYSEGTQASPPDIAEHALQTARLDGHSVLLIDTAGRLQVDERLMGELEEIRRRVTPHEIIMVVNAAIGQESVNVATEFHRRVPLTGLIMTQVDGDARGGASLSIREVTGVPIKFLGTGEKIELGTIEPFHPDRLAQRILGMGDMMTLIEKSMEAFDEEQAKRDTKRMMKGQFNFEDFLENMRKMRSIGSLSSIIKMIPGLGNKFKDIDEMIDEKELKRVEAIIQSMTLKERRNPDMINMSRRLRIARGSGTDIQDVNALIKQFKEMQRTMKKFGKNGRGGPDDLLRMLK